ncbi:MAG: PilW family protein [Pseudomonadota bacterium]
MSSPRNLKQQGLTLVELMIAVALGALVSIGIVQVLVGNRFSDDLNTSIASAQENGRFIVTRLRNDIMMAGYHNPLFPDLNDSVDVTEENAFVRNNVIPLPGDFTAWPTLGSKEGAATASDTLVISKQEQHDCRGKKLGYADDEEFFVVNEYFLESDELRCRGFDGRVLRGQRIAVDHNNHEAVTLMENVLSFQVMYGITASDVNATTGNPVKYIDASQLNVALNDNAHVVAIKIALIIKGDGDGFVETHADFKLLNEDSIAAPDKGLYQAFETTITLRNAKNFVRANI